MKLFNSALVLLIVVNFVHSEQNNETLEKESHVVGEPTEEELQKRRNDKLAAMPYSHPPPDPEKARLLIYEYDIQTVDHIHNPTEPEENGIKTETKAKYYFELLNHDQNGCILARYQIYECITGDCENVPDIYIYIVQGGQNVLGVWYKPKDENKKINWGLTLSLAYAVTSPAKSGEGDEQIVKTPFGRCRQFFGRPQDKLFTRKMDLCDFESNRNHTLFPGLLNLDYQQFIEYKQNKKIDADIVFVEADEQFLIQTPSQPESAIRIHSHLSAEMMNRTRRYMKRYCPKGMLGSACATEIFGAKYLGKNWLDVNTKLVELSRSEISLTEFVSKKRKEFKKCQNTNDCVELFKNLTNIIRETEPETIVQIVQNFKDEEILNFLLSGVAIVGPTTAWKEVFKHAYKLGRLLAQQFLDNIAFTTVPPTTALKEIHNWEKVNFDVDFYNIIGYLTQKRCLSTPSNLNACNLNKDSFFKNLLKNTDKLTPEQQSKSLWHLNFKSTSDYFSQFLCSGNYNSDLQERSLTFYNKLHPSFFERSINMKLLNIFWNTCPQPVSTVQSVLALNILVRIAPDYPTVGSFLLRSEKINPENHNLWALFYQKVKSSIEHGTHKVRRYWSELRHLKAFRPNYLQRSLKHKSSNFIENYQNLTLPMTVKGTYVANAKEDFEEFNVAFSSHVPILEVKMSKTLQILDIFGLPQILDKKEKNQFLPIRDYSQKIRLLSGNTLDLTLNVIAGLQTKSEKSTVTVKSSILIGTTAELFGSQTNQGSMNSQLLISNEVKIGHEKSCPVIDFENWLAKTATTKTFVEKQEEKVSSRKHTGFSLNLGQSVNSHC